MGKQITIPVLKKRIFDKWGTFYGVELIECLPKGMHTMIPVVCPKHGEFQIRAYSLLQGVGCRVCGNERKKQRFSKSHEEFEKEAREKHGDLYKYDKFVFINMETKGIIECPTHGQFLQSPHHHIHLGHGCPECGKIKSHQTQTFTTSWFRKRADFLHPENNHSESVYIDTHTPLKVICPDHGIFEIRPCDYLNLNQGCPVCGHSKAGLSLRMSTSDFIRRASAMPEHKFINYSKTTIEGTQTLATFTCQKHGDFTQMPSAHLNGQSCPLCYSPISKGEQILADYITNLGFVIKQSYREWSGHREIDIYIPDRKIGFEINGIFRHHSGVGYKPRLYHRDKSRDALQKGIRLIHLWDSNTLDQNKSIIVSKLGQARKIYARKTCFQSLSSSEANAFLKINHLQGSAGRSTIWAGGLFFENKIVAVMTFRRFGKEVELSRFASAMFTQVVGGFSKLLQQFIMWGKPQGFTKIISFANRDIAPDPDQSVYAKMGFILINTPEDPMLRYCDPKRGLVLNRQRFMKHRLPSLWTDVSYDDLATKTERQICEEHGVMSLYGSGRWKFEKLL